MAASPEAWFNCTLGEDALLFRRMLCREELGRLPAYSVDLSRSQRLDPIVATDLLGTQATIKLQRSNQEFRYINGWIESVELGGAVGRYDVYHVVLRSWLWHLTLGADCRIFQNKNALEVIQAVFADYSSAQVDVSKLSGTPRKRPYCVQYRESDFNFVSRLMEEEGIWYYFVHVEGRHTLVLANSASGHVALPEGTLAWSEQREGTVHEDVVTKWRQSQQLRSMKFTHDDYDHEAPTTELEKTDQRTVSYPTPGDLEVYDWPGTFAYPGDANNATQGATDAKLRVRRYETGHLVATASTPCRSVAAGMTFHFSDHPRYAGDYLITGVSYEADFGEEEASTGNQPAGFTATMRLVPQTAPFATEARTPKPIVRGPQTATVVGPSGNEIHVDRLGRVKVHFRWDRVGPRNEGSTCFVRVATPWASKSYGMISHPRIGDEVVVSFLEGNPDRPLITGSVYNGDNLPPYALPAQATVSGIRSRSSSGGSASNFNELRFDDKTGSEYVWLRAEKNFHRLVKNDATDQVTQNQQVEIGKNYTSSIGEAYDLAIGKTAQLDIGSDTSVHVGGDMNLAANGGASLNVGAALDLSVGAAAALTSGAAMEVQAGASISITAATSAHIKASTGVVIDGGVSLTIKAGGSFIVIDPSGVSIVGPMVKNNSGGSGGSAKSAAKANPTAPTSPAKVVRKNDPIG
ncbi:MAG: type VI secretion system tip protein VgrG [Pseudomonadota bacterium]|nr:type VI secretion system tip protein VgrG [Pseudomonadota bacterium]MDQ2764420.1 type VI secretion system tip protein VgrG [Pseudomonadota bacterium]